jgi:DNA polymerase-3 subunit epsilon
MNDPTAPVSSLVFVAFDFETTGLYAGRDKIVEFGAVKFQGNREIDRFQALSDPGFPMPAEVTRVSGITDSLLKGQPGFKAILPSFLAFLDGAVLVAHNADFDVGFLRAAMLDSQFPSLENLIIDTVGLAKRAFPGQKSYSLQNLASYLRFPPNTAHRALDDAIMCMKLFQSCAQSLSFMGEITLSEVIA